MPSSITSDGVTLARLITAEFPSELVVDVGCGSGAVAIGVAATNPATRVFAIDIDEEACAEAREACRAVEVEARVEVRCADALRTCLPTQATVCCNPPLLPGEPGFAVIFEEEEKLFWHALVDCVFKPDIRARHLILHVFSFHGIRQRTGKWPSVWEVAATHDLRVTLVHKRRRLVGDTSSVRKRLVDVASHFPEGEIEVDGRLCSLREAVKLGRKTLAAVPLAVYSTFLTLSHSYPD